jgi:hypothetical protein
MQSMKIFTENRLSEFILRDGEVIHGVILYMSFDKSYKNHYLIREHNVPGFMKLLNSDRQAARHLCERFDLDRIRKSKPLTRPNQPSFLNN